MAKDQICEQISMKEYKEYIDSFTGEPEKEGKSKNKNNNDQE